jgi:ABC-type sugar transport system ATPase subunit
VRIELQQVSVGLSSSSGDPHPALNGVSLTVPNGELLTVVGPSGAGKSTLLRIIAGLERGYRGKVFLDGTPAEGLPPHRRHLVFTPQNPTLFPHLSVANNILLSLQQRGTTGAPATDCLQEAAEAFQIRALLQRLPHELSGGERQRAALARAFALRPGLFLLDEPLANIDAALRCDLRRVILDYHQRLRTTLVLVTHDQEEAMSFGGRLAVLARGSLVQSGDAAEVYTQPANLFVAGFLGTPRMNFIAGVIRQGSFAVEGKTAPFPARISPVTGAADGTRVVLAFRPEALRTTRDAAQGDQFGLDCRLLRTVDLGASRVCELETAYGRLNARSSAGLPEPLSQVWVELRNLLLFDAAGGQASPLA